MIEISLTAAVLTTKLSNYTEGELQLRKCVTQNDTIGGHSGVEGIFNAMMCVVNFIQYSGCEGFIPLLQKSPACLPFLLHEHFSIAKYTTNTSSKQICITNFSFKCNKHASFEFKNFCSREIFEIYISISLQPFKSFLPQHFLGPEEYNRIGSRIKKINRKNPN